MTATRQDRGAPPDGAGAKKDAEATSEATPATSRRGPPPLPPEARPDSARRGPDGAPTAPESTPLREAAARAAKAHEGDDRRSLEGVLVALYESISGPPGDRAWDRFRALFAPDARLVQATKIPRAAPRPRATAKAESWTVDAFVAGVAPTFAANGFFATEIGRCVDRFGHVAHVFSSYERRTTEKGPVESRGLNSVQLFFDGDRWWILSMAWDAERPGQSIPPEYLGSQG